VLFIIHLLNLLFSYFSAGYNCSLIVTGYKGSGKSYTAAGNADNVGIVPIALQQIFQKIYQNGISATVLLLKV